MATDGEFVEEFESQSVHVCHRQHRDDLVSGFQFEYFVSELGVRPEAAVGEHDSFRVARCAGGVVDYCQLFGLVFMVFDVFLAEVLRIFPAEHFVQMFAGMCQPFAA